MKLEQQMPGQVLAVTLQCFALWETVGEVDWLDAYWVFPPNLYTVHPAIFWHTANIACIYIQHTTNYFLAKSVCAASIVCGFEYSLSFL